MLYREQRYTRTPEEAAAKSISSGIIVNLSYRFYILLYFVKLLNFFLNLIGVDLDCGTFLSNFTGAAVNAKLIREADIDRAVSNNFATLMRLGFFDGDPTKQVYGNLGPRDVCTPENQELGREAARQGIVLLKNSKGSLPLSRDAIKKLALVGPNADATYVMIGNYAGT